MKIRYKATIAYNGSNYHGWAKQPNQQTIQGILESTILELFNQQAKVFAAGRTDAGVNALGQVIHFDLSEMKIKPKDIKNALNKALPYDIRILKLQKTNKDFNARFMAKNKTYVYSINVGSVNPLETSIVYQYNRPINIRKIRQAAKLFVGKKNFLSFSTDERNGESVIKKIDKINIRVKKNIIYISVNGDGFLRSQIRMIVGTLLAYERGKSSMEQIMNLFEQPKKGASTYKAPACGLCLKKVNY